jgi:predicted nucleotidyltransferase
VKLKINHESLGRFCREHGIARLELFGSALRDDFHAESDVDLLATLRGEARPTMLDWADMQEKLTLLFGRPVDLVSRRAIERSRNRYRKHAIPPPRPRFMRKDRRLQAYLAANPPPMS